MISSCVLRGLAEAASEADNKAREIRKALRVFMAEGLANDSEKVSAEGQMLKNNIRDSVIFAGVTYKKS